MLRKVFIPKERNNIVLNLIHKFSSSKESIRLTDLFVKSNKDDLQEAGEIINMSNDSNNLNIPRSTDFRQKGVFFTNDLVSASLNERATLNLSSHMYANTPEPPNEVINIHDRPYNSIMSLGGCEAKNEKFIADELIMSHDLTESQCPKELSYQQMMISMYISNEERFGIQIIENARDMIASGELDVTSALDYQMNVMQQVEKYWHESLKNTVNELHLFIPYPSEENEDVTNIIKLYKILNIVNKEENISRFNMGLLSLVSLVKDIDEAVTTIVSNWRSSQIHHD